MNLLFLQCLDSDPADLVEIIKDQISNLADPEEAQLRNKPAGQKSKAPLNHSPTLSYVSESEGGSLRGSLYNENFLGSFSGTDSVRSATIKRIGRGGRPRSSIQTFDQGPIPGVAPPEVIPVAMPTPPPSTKSKMERVKKESTSSRQSHHKETSDDFARYKPPLVSQLSRQLLVGPSALEPKHRFQYNATADLKKKGNFFYYSFIFLSFQFYKIYIYCP